jgi:hypothetical protein
MRSSLKRAFPDWLLIMLASNVTATLVLLHLHSG